MSSSMRVGGCVVILLAAVGCGERSQPLPQAPSLAPSFEATAAPTTTLCDFRSVSRFATRYFSGTEQKTVRDIVTAMQTAGAGTATAQDRGFDVMTHVVANIDAGNSDAADASGLTNGLLACMYSDPASLPATFPEDFTVATTPALHGGYAVRGGATDPQASPVLNRPYTAPFSGIAPPGLTTWPQMLSGNPAPSRILVYGKPGSRPQSYDWKVVPRTTTFSPPAQVAVCVDATTNGTDLLHEENVGILPFLDAPWLNPATCSSVATAGSWSATLARRVAGWGIDLLGPKALWAHGLMNPGGLGGSTGGIHSEFGPERVDTVQLTFVVQPTDVSAGQIISPAVQVLATAPGTNDPVPQVVITVGSFDNNGTPAVLGGTLSQTTNAAGIATFGDLTESKTGGYLLTAVGGVIGRSAIGVPQVRSVRFNVRP